MSNQRGHFRLEYPPADRPIFKLDAKSQFEVLDLSEKGIKFSCGPRFRPKDNSPIKGTIVFKDGKTCDVAGTVLRYIADKNAAVVNLTQGVPLAKMLEEQRYLLQKYKAS